MKTKEDNQRRIFKLPRNMTLVWLKGFMNGRTGTAALNDEQVVQSGYIRMLCKQFEGFSADQIRELDIELHALSAEAEKLILELHRLEKPLPDIEPTPEEATVIEQRAAQRKEAELNSQREMRRFRRKEVLDRLVEIRTAFSELEIVCQETLLKTAFETESVLASYCKGVMYRKPLTEFNIPEMNISDAIKQLHENVQWTTLCLSHIDEEVQKNHEEI